MRVRNPEVLPATDMDRESMLALQARVRELARFSDDSTTPDTVGPETIIVGVDLAFVGDDAIAAAVAIRDNEPLEHTVVREPVAIPYIPGLLAFREAGPMLAAITRLDVELDLLLVDGNGRIHPREAGLATHVGVALDRPAIGVAKSLLCGELSDAPDAPLTVGTRVPIAPDDSMDGASGPLGYAVQTRQWDRPDRAINPVYVSPGHRVSADTAVDLVFDCLDGYKLPEPIRRADHLAGVRADEG